MKRYVFSCIFLALTLLSYAQETTYPVAAIPDSLMQNANAVIRLHEMNVTIESQRSMTITEKRIVTVLNEKGMGVLGASAQYDKTTTVRNISATVYDAAGKEIKKIKRKDFRDVCPTGGFVFFSDTRMIYLDYTPTQYPFTLVFDCETHTSNTAFIYPWRPIDCLYSGVERSVFSIRFPEKLGMKKKELHFSGFNIARQTQTATQLVYTAANIPPQKREPFSPDFDNIYPKVVFGLDHFSLEGVDGTATTWKDFGLWYSEKILTGTTELPEATKQKMKALVGTEKDPVKKARIVYDYVQQKSRYVNVSVGIGGWKPMPASDVDRLGYGDCKALSNYTGALLRAVDVPAYYTIVFADDGKRNIDPDFVTMQGNHVMLAVPDGNHYVWMECTSQDIPFGYQAEFTDDRNVLLVKPEGGEIAHTKKYDDQTNVQNSKGVMAISAAGQLSGAVSIASEGSQYMGKYQLETKPPLETEAHYKEYWDNIGNLKIKKTAFRNDKEQVRFTEDIELEAPNYGSFSGNRMMFAVNAFNQFSLNVKRARNRKTPFEIARGSFDQDEIAIELPDGFAIEALPQGIALSGKFGTYKTEIIKTDDKHLVYKRSLLLKEGFYTNIEYEDFRAFMEQISRNDNAKLVLIKT